MQRINNTLAQLLRACMRRDGGDFLCLEPIMKKTTRKGRVVWGGGKGAVLVLQIPAHLQGPIFGKGDWQEAEIIE